MKSIRRTLIIYLLAGLTVVWGLAGTILYYSVKRGEEERFDRGLRRAVPMVRSRAVLRDRPPPPDSEKRPLPEGVYYQIWNPSGEAFARSENLTADLQRPEMPAVKDEKFWNTEIQDGLPVRVVYMRSDRLPRGFRGSQRQEARKTSQPLDILVAADRTPLRETLTTLIIGIVGTGLAAALASAGLVHLALRRGLHPLHVFGERLSEIDARSLDQRFTPEGLADELVPVAEKFDALLARLEAGFQRERQFSADLAHELRTPVAELKMLTEVAQKWPDDTAAAASALSGGVEIAAQMERIIEGILTLARCEGQSQKPLSEEIELDALVAECIKRLPPRDIDDADIAGATVESDPKLLGIVVGNLLSNAAAYTPLGGKITVSVPDVDTVLEVSNTVAGVSEADVEKMFQRLWRGDSARTESGHFGLGLPLARACAEVCGLQLEGRLVGEEIRFSLKTPPPDKR